MQCHAAMGEKTCPTFSINLAVDKGQGLTLMRLRSPRGVPNMNSLIAMGALTSFAAGLATPLLPGLALDGSALEEPIMLLAFVLLGRTLEARARLKASGAPLPSSRLASEW